jgi:hypothetical protein
MLSSCQSGKVDQEGHGESEGDKKPIIHIHSIGEEEIENFIEVSCEADGSYDSVFYCTECDMEMSREIKIVKSEGHISTEPIVEGEILNTCLENGRRETATYCSVCKTELSREIEILEAKGHMPTEPTIIYGNENICKSEGSCVKIVNCSICSTEISRETEIIPMVGHTWVDGKCEKCDVPYSVEESLELMLSEDGSYYIITGIGTFYETELIIPSEYKGLPIKEIADHAFRNSTFIVRAVIPSSIVRLGYGAAEGCTALEELILEDRSGWSLYDGHEDPKIFPIPSFMLIDTSNFFDLLLYGDQFALVKNEK